MTTAIYHARPFIKWAGGKTQLLPQLFEALPAVLQDKEFTYVEPFVGGGAMLFFMLSKFPNIKKVVINDINTHLINAYRVIIEAPEKLITSLKILEKDYLLLNDLNKRKDCFLEKRNAFNVESLSTIDKTAHLIFLNKTCFNGLYRENSKGHFNVPHGRYSNPLICNEELIIAVSELLNSKNMVLRNDDFSKTAEEIDKNSINFFYFDPPYRPLSSTSSFNSYVKYDFNDESQNRLAHFYRQLNENTNNLLMLSNSDCSAKKPNDTFFENLYSGFNIKRVMAARSISANPRKRGKLTELLILNYLS